jgi:hypothetical protein
MTSPRIDLRPGVSEPVVLMFSRREVEAGDPSALVERLNSLFNTRDAIWRYRGQVALAVDGYNDDPRELVDVPEVRAFLVEFDQQWPYWAFYFNQVDDSIKLLASCLCAGRYLGRGQVEIDAEKLQRFLLTGFAAMNSIFDEHGFAEAELEAMSNGVIEVIEQAGMV